jgi:hypothetical protein
MVLDRDLESPDPLGISNDLDLVHADEGTQYRKSRSIVNRTDVLERLRRHLTLGLARHQCQRAITFGDHLGYPDHQAAVQEHSQIRWTHEGYLTLKIAEWDEVDAANATIALQHLADLGDIVL